MFRKVLGVAIAVTLTSCAKAGVTQMDSSGEEFEGSAFVKVYPTDHPTIYRTESSSKMLIMSFGTEILPGVKPPTFIHAWEHGKPLDKGPYPTNYEAAIARHFALVLKQRDLNIADLYPPHFGGWLTVDYKLYYGWITCGELQINNVKDTRTFTAIIRNGAVIFSRVDSASSLKMEADCKDVYGF